MRRTSVRRRALTNSIWRTHKEAWSTAPCTRRGTSPQTAEYQGRQTAERCGKQAVLSVSREDYRWPAASASEAAARSHKSSQHK